MKGVYDKLLLPVEEFSFELITDKRRWVNQQGNASVEGQGSEWECDIKANDGYIHYKKSFTSKKAAIKYLLNTFPEAGTDHNFSLSSNRSYILVPPKCYQHLNIFNDMIIFGRKNSWKLNSYGYNYRYTDNLTISLENAITKYLSPKIQKEFWGRETVFNTKPLIVSCIRQLLTERLDHVYDEQLYLDIKNKPETLSGNTLKRAWWLPFVSPEVELDKIF